MIVLDTNVVSEGDKPSPDAHVMAWLRGQSLANLATTAVSLAEINYGLCRLRRGRHRDDLEARLRTFLARGFDERILAFDAAAVEGELENFKESGRASFDVACTIDHGGKRAVAFTGKYVVHAKRS